MSELTEPLSEEGEEPAVVDGLLDPCVLLDSHGGSHGLADTTKGDGVRSKKQGATMQEFDLKTLAEFDGSNGKPIYVAHQGKVYDVSRSKLWKDGAHQKRHHAGEDLTEDMESAPHKPDLLLRFPQVGVLKNP
jgi:predicted heme/steroid binding protein